MIHHLVYTLSKFRVLVWQELRADANVASAPVPTAVIGAIESGAGYGDAHAVRIAWIDNDRVETEATTTGLPFRPVGVVVKTLDEAPALTDVARFKKRGGLDSGIDDVRLRLTTGENLPYLNERGVKSFGKLHVVTVGFSPGLSEVVARAQHAAPVEAACCCKCATTAAALIHRERVNRFTREMWSIDSPFASCRVGPDEERALQCSDQQHDLVGRTRIRCGRIHHSLRGNAIGLLD